MQDIDRYSHWGQLINESEGDLIENKILNLVYLMDKQLSLIHI